MLKETGLKKLCRLNLTLDILEIFITLKNYSKNNYLVGGCVRDSLMGKTPKDYDIVTDTPIKLLEKTFGDNGWSVGTSGMNFLVLNISKNHVQYEIANFRKDGKYEDGRRPDSVEVGTIDDDAARRDFTVNSLYCNPFSGVVIDPTGLGLKDIEDRTLRFIGKPSHRIEEDRLRIFRFYRFLLKGFKPEIKSHKACRSMFRESLPMITPERIREEIEKMVNV